MRSDGRAKSAENKYDTRGLEASYLAKGNPPDAETLSAREEFAAFKARAFGRRSHRFGRVVELEGAGGAALYFIAARRSTEIVHQKRTLVVMTPQSPWEPVGGPQRKDRILLEIAVPRVLHVARVW